MKEHSIRSVTEEQRRYGQKDQDLVCNGFSGNDTRADDKATYIKVMSYYGDKPPGLKKIIEKIAQANHMQKLLKCLILGAGLS